MKIGFLLTALLLVFSTILFVRNRAAGRDNAIRTAQMKSLNAQLNPHFVFNALNSIQNLVNKHDIENTNHYLSEFAKLMRSVVDNINKTLIPLENDVRALKNYLALEQLRFPFRYNVDQKLGDRAAVLEVIPFLTQPILENSVKHGIAGMGEKGEILLTIYESGKDLIYEIKDNGFGFNADAALGGKGISLVRERIQLYNLSSKFAKIYFESQSGKDGTVSKIIYKNFLK